MYKVFFLILCLLIFTPPVEAQKRDSRRRDPSPVEREHGGAARAFAKQQQREKGERDKQRANAQPAAHAPVLLPPPTPATTVGGGDKATAAFTRPLPPIFVVNKTPDAYKRRFSDPDRATNPRKVRERRARGHDDNLKNQYMFPVKPNAVVRDALGRRLGRLAPTVRLEVGGLKLPVSQQIRINKNEGQMLGLRGRKPEKYEMAPGLLLTNGQRVSGLIRRADIPSSDRPKPARPRRAPAPKGETIPFAITGGDPYRPAPTLTGIAPDTGRRVPLKFPNPNTNPPRGYTGPHREGNDYLPKRLNRDPTSSAHYTNLLGDKLPGRGGIARTVVRIDRGDKTPPIFEVYARRDAETRKLYLPGRTDPKTSLIFLPGRLRGAGRDLGTLYIAVPNLSPLPVPRRRR